MPRIENSFGGTLERYASPSPLSSQRPTRDTHYNMPSQPRAGGTLVNVEDRHRKPPDRTRTAVGGRDKRLRAGGRPRPARHGRDGGHGLPVHRHAARAGGGPHGRRMGANHRPARRGHVHDARVRERDSRPQQRPELRGAPALDQRERPPARAWARRNAGDRASGHGAPDDEGGVARHRSAPHPPHDRPGPEACLLRQARARAPDHSHRRPAADSRRERGHLLRAVRVPSRPRLRSVRSPGRGGRGCAPRGGEAADSGGDRCSLLRLGRGIAAARGGDAGADHDRGGGPRPGARRPPVLRRLLRQRAQRRRPEAPRCRRGAAARHEAGHHHRVCSAADLIRGHGRPAGRHVPGRDRAQPRRRSGHRGRRCRGRGPDSVERRRPLVARAGLGTGTCARSGRPSSQSWTSLLSARRPCTPSTSTMRSSPRCAGTTS